MTNYSVYEDEGKSVQEELNTNPNIVVGDTIEYISDNQMGYKKYRVMLGANNVKTLKLIDSYEHQIGIEQYEDEDGLTGGKTNKRKTNKRKTNKRKTNKRKTNKRKRHHRK